MKLLHPSLPRSLILSERQLVYLEQQVDIHHQQEDNLGSSFCRTETKERFPVIVFNALQLFNNKHNTQQLELKKLSFDP